MIDHLLYFEDEADLLAVLAAHGGSRAYRCHVVLAEAVWDHTDSQAPALVSDAVYHHGFHAWAVLPALDLDAAGPTGILVMAADRSANIIIHANEAAAALLTTARIEPMPAGVVYVAPGG